MRPASAHIRLDERGVAWIDDTGYKVLPIVGDYLTRLSPQPQAFDKEGVLLSDGWSLTTIPGAERQQAEHDCFRHQVRRLHCSRTLLP
jgi:hypothetical protein